MQEYELPILTPPSPALSARSDTSNQSTLARLRNLSLMGGRPSKAKYILPLASTEGVGNDRTNRHDSSLDLQSSLERLSHRISTLASSSSSGAGSPTASSSTFVDSGDEEDAEEEGDIEEQNYMKKRIRRESMPGSLIGSDDEQEEFEGDEAYGHEYEYENEAAAEQAFDDDLFATGEMKNVPFL